MSWDRHTIVAPFAGVIVREFTEVGQWLAEGGAVVELMALDELEVAVDVPERYYGGLRPRTRTQVVFEALGGMAVAGRISAVIPRADPQARTFKMKVRIPNPGGRIGVGMLAQILVPDGNAYNATVVPKDAVVAKGSQKVVYVMNGDNTVTELPVETGSGVGAWIEVQGAVKAGQRVVTRGNERLRQGQPVQGASLEVPLP